MSCYNIQFVKQFNTEQRFLVSAKTAEAAELIVNGGRLCSQAEIFKGSVQALEEEKTSCGYFLSQLLPS